MEIFNALHDYIGFYPLVAFICLLLAGFSIPPFSEDLVIITGAIVCSKEHSLIIPTLGAIYLGAIGTDFMVYWFGLRVRRGVSKSKLITKVLTKKRFDTLHHYLDKFGIFTFIVCRFIPFGVRNGLMLTAGMANLRLRVYAIYDVTAALISINTLFFLVYFLGEQMEKPIKTIGVILFILLVCAIGFIIVRLAIRWRKTHASSRVNTESYESGQEQNNP